MKKPLLAIWLLMLLCVFNINAHSSERKMTKVEGDDNKLSFFYENLINETAVKGQQNSNIFTPMPSVAPSFTSTPQTSFFKDDFENEATFAQWRHMTKNGDIANGKWIRGTAAGGEGSTAYITNDGTSYKDPAKNSGAILLFQDITFGNFDNGEIVISFDWKAQGDANHRLRVFLMDADDNSLSEGIAPHVNINYSSDWLYQNKDWSRAYLSLKETSSFFKGKTQRLVFMWWSNFGDTELPVGAIDNVEVGLYACNSPRNLKLESVTAEEANFSWDGGAGGYDFEYRKKGETETQWVPAYIATSASNTSLSGLNENTFYEVRMRTKCATDNNSSWINMFFKTRCPIYPFPIYQKFEETSTTAQAVPSCWNYRTFNSSKISATTENPKEGTKSLYLNTQAGYVTLITPWIDKPVGKLQVTFWAKGKDNLGGKKLKVGYTDTVVDGENINFTPIYTITTVTNEVVWKQHILKFDQVTANAHYIVFHADASNWFYIDDIKIDTLPDCENVMDLAIEDVTYNDVTITYTSTETKFTVDYKKETDPEDSWTRYDLAGEEVIENNRVRITGLDSETKYLIRVHSVCDAGYGFWDTIKVTTLCAPIPYSTVQTVWKEGFEGLTKKDELPACMKVSDIYVSSTGSNGIINTWNSRISNVREPRTGNGYATFTSAGGRPVNYIFTPLFALRGGKSYRFSFYYKTDSTSHWNDLSVSLCRNQKTDAGDIVLKSLKRIRSNGYEYCFVDYTLAEDGNYAFAISCKVAAVTNGVNGFLCIDDLEVKLTPNCGQNQPTNITLVGSYSPTAVKVTWESIAGTSFKVQYKPVADNTWTDHNGGNSITTKYCKLEGLAPNTLYDIRVWNICDISGTPTESDTTVAKFKTMACQNIVNAGGFVNEGFDGMPAGAALPECWSKIAEYYSKADKGSKVEIVRESGNYATPPNTVKLEQHAYCPPESAIMLISPPFSPSLNKADIITRFKANNSEVTKENIHIGIMTNPEDASTFQMLQTIKVGKDDGWLEVDEKYLTGYTGDNELVWYVAYKHGNTLPVSHSLAHLLLDDIFIAEKGKCDKVTGLKFIDAKQNSIKISYTSDGPDPSFVTYIVEYQKEGDVVWTNVPLPTANAKEVEITGLETHTAYLVRVRSNCGTDMNGNWTDYLRCKTTQEPAKVTELVAYEENFDNSDKWTFVNQNTNQWCVGDNVANKGDKGAALYITNNTTTKVHEYTKAKAVAGISHVYRDIEFTGGDEYILDFDWESVGAKAPGEDFRDYLSIKLVDPTIVPMAGEFVEGYDYLTGTSIGKVYFFQYDWTRENKIVQSLSNTTKRLVFTWVTKGTWDVDMFNPPAAIDNIKVTSSSCSSPYEFKTNAVSVNSATIQWENANSSFFVDYREIGRPWQMYNTDGNLIGKTVTLTGLKHSTDYEIRVKTKCPASESQAVTHAFKTECGAFAIPYDCDFTDYSGHPNCWEALSAALPLLPTSSAGFSKTTEWNRFSFASQATPPFYAEKVRLTSTGRNLWLITPEVNLGTAETTLEFNLGLFTYSSSNPALEIGPNDTLAILVSTEDGKWSKSNIAAIWTNKGGAGDKVFKNISSATTGGERMTIPLTGATGKRRIAFYVSSAGGYSGSLGNELYIGKVYVRNTVTCLPVTDLKTVVTGTSVAANWKAPVAQTQNKWEVRCIKESNSQVIFTEQATTTSIIFNNLERDTKYYIEVSAICGPEQMSPTTKSANFIIGKCDGVTNVDSKNICPTTATVLWEKVAQNQSQWQIGYRLKGETAINTVLANQDTAQISGLSKETIYEYAVRAVCGVNDTGSYSTFKEFTTTSCEKLQAKDISIVRDIDSLYISWIANSCHQEYQIRVLPKGADTTSAPIITAKSTEIEKAVYVSDITASYDIYVRANCGSETYSDWEYTLGINGVNNASAVKAALIPNPAHGYTKLNIEGVTGNIEISILTLSGKVLQKETVFCQHNLNRDIRLEGFAKGTYFVRIVHKDWTKVEKLVVQ